MKVIIYSDITPNPDVLFRGELHAIIDVMRARLNVKSLRPYIVAPASHSRQQTEQRDMHINLSFIFRCCCILK